MKNQWQYALQRRPWGPISAFERADPALQTDIEFTRDFVFSSICLMSYIRYDSV